MRWVKLNHLAQYLEGIQKISFSFLFTLDLIYNMDNIGLCEGQMMKLHKSPLQKI